MQKSLDKRAGIEASEDAIQQRLNQEARRKERVTQLLPYLGIVILTVFFELITKGRFLESANLKLLLNQCFTMAILMTGASFLYSLGSLDMAVGMVMCLSALVLSKFYNAGVPLLISLLAGIAVSCLCMSVTGFAKCYLKVDPFIASLCVMNITQGIVMATNKVSKTYFPYSKAPWLNSIPIQVIVLLALIVIGYMLFNYTAFGKSVRAIGGNAKVAAISGIKVNKVTILAYVVMGVVVGIASLFAVVRGGEADLSIGSGVNLNVMIAVVLGGFPLTGGSGARYSAPIIGALMVTVLTNGLGMIGQANAMGYAIKGLLFIIVIGLTYEKSNGKLVS